MKNLNEYDLSVELNNDTNQLISASDINGNEFDNSREHFINNNYDIYSEESDEESEIEKLNNNKLHGTSTHKNNSQHLLLTTTINLYNKNKIRKEYEIWLKKNYVMLQSSFYIISNKFLDDSYKKKITFKKFSEFCFLYY
jgi:hypothetical protein